MAENFFYKLQVASANRFTSKPLTVVVTGASAGLGRAIAHAYARRGAQIGLIARNPEALDAAKEECEALGGKAISLPTDVSDADAVEAAAAHVEKLLGLIDVWVNDAMVSVFSPVKEMEPSDYKRVTDVLYLGFVHGTLAALRRMLPVIAGLSSKSAPRCPTARCRCSRLIVLLNTPSTVSLTRSVASCTTTPAR